MHSSEETAYYKSPAGWIRISACPEGIDSLVFSDPVERFLQEQSGKMEGAIEENNNHETSGANAAAAKSGYSDSIGYRPVNQILAECIAQLKLYFAGELREFTLPMYPSGTPFQLRVWDELVKIPYGHVITYTELGKRLGGPNYTRIVGQANGRNPISIIIPCHRVIGMNGALTGYAGGLKRKQFLLDLEQKGRRTDFTPRLFDND